MESQRFKADAAGKILAPLGGYGFALFPASPEESDMLLQRPGAFPLFARLMPGPQLLIANSTPLLFATPFSRLELTGAQKGDIWQVATFGKDERIAVAGTRARSSHLVKAGLLTVGASGWDLASSVESYLATYVATNPDGYFIVDPAVAAVSVYLRGIPAGGGTLYLWTRPGVVGSNWYLYEKMAIDGVDATATVARALPPGAFFVTGIGFGASTPLFEIRALLEVG